MYKQWNILYCQEQLNIIKDCTKGLQRSQLMEKYGTLRNKGTPQGKDKVHLSWYPVREVVEDDDFIVNIIS